MVTIRNYKKAESLEEAWRLNQQRGNRILGGMLWMKMGKGTIQTAIDLSGLGLDKIEETPEGWRIGCMVTLRQLELHEGLEEYTGGALREALRHIVGVQFRNLATVGGSVFGRFGFSDVCTMLAAMDSYVELYRGGEAASNVEAPLNVKAAQSERAVPNVGTVPGAKVSSDGVSVGKVLLGGAPIVRVPMREFLSPGYGKGPFSEDASVKTAEKASGKAAGNESTGYDRDVLVSVLIRREPAAYCYQSVRNSQADFPVLSCGAAWISGEGGHRLRLSVGARPARAICLESGLFSDEMTQEEARAFGEYAEEHIPTGSNLRGSAAYRSHLVRVLAMRAALRLGDSRPSFHGTSSGAGHAGA